MDRGCTDVLCGQLSRRCGRLGVRKAAAHLLRPAGPETGTISFDAAWGNEDTQELIDILDRFQVKATFFVVGDWVDKYPESVKALHDAGHEVMNHSNTHAHYPSAVPAGGGR